MHNSNMPLVSVVTPVFNGEKHLARCIQSVLEQTYANFQYTIVDNCSKDRTAEIARGFACRDKRVRVYSATEFVDVVASHNRAFEVAAQSGATYCKLINADDWLFPNCISEMVRLADAHPSVGIVSSYVLSGTHVAYDGLPYPSDVTSGREICRQRLMDGLRVFGGPSASLIRCDVLRQQRPFYNPTNFHGDNEAYLTLLQDHDFGFVHQVLSYHRRGEDSRTTYYLGRVRSHALAAIEESLRFGPVYLTPEEHAHYLDQRMRAFYRLLAQSVMEMRDAEFWEYNRKKAASLGIPINNVRLAGYVVLRLIDIALNPKRSIETLWSRFVG